MVVIEVILAISDRGHSSNIDSIGANYNGSGSSSSHRRHRSK